MRGFFPFDYAQGQNDNSNGAALRMTRDILGAVFLGAEDEGVGVGVGSFVGEVEGEASGVLGEGDGAGADKVTGDGVIDSDERAFLQAIATWIPKHGEAIYGTRPFSVYGEGPADIVTGQLNERTQRTYTSEDIRFTRKGDTVYAFALGWPANGKLLIKTLTRGGSALPKPIQRVDLIGAGSVPFTQDASGLTLNLPDKAPN